MERILVVGAGAIGRHLAAALAGAGIDTTLLGRGAAVQAIAAHGLRIEGDGAAPPRTVRLNAIEYRPGPGGYDAVFVCVKSHQLAGIAPALAATIGRDAALVFPQNGLPWWYFDGCAEPLRGARIRCLDPDGDLARYVDPARIVGAVIYKSVQAIGPDAIRTVDLPEDRLVLGEPDGTRSARVAQLAALVERTGLPVVQTADIRREKWRKLVTNVAWNPVCALTRSTIAEVSRDPETRRLCGALMAEALRVARRVGASPDVDPDAVLEAGARKTGHVPSMLQDLRAGRTLEHAAIVGALLEVGALVGETLPTLAAIGALIAQLDASTSSPR